jgi:alpha-glucosidase
MRRSFYRYADSVLRVAVEKDEAVIYQTGAVITSPLEELESGRANGFISGIDFSATGRPGSISIEESAEGFVIVMKLREDQGVFGLGQEIGPLNKRGRIYEMYNTDDPDHSPSKTRLYSTLPVFYLISPEGCTGFFLDHAGYSKFDVAFEKRDTLLINVEGKAFDLYGMSGTPGEIIKKIFGLTGKPLFLPVWSLGFQQSRWSYPDEESVMYVASKMREKEIPCDVIYLDIDYMDDYKVFTWNGERFPDPRSMVKRLKEMGFKVVTIVDPGVKAAEGYRVFEEGKRENVFCKKEDGRDFRPAVWPGEARLPDFLNSKARRWWGDLYREFVELGISGFWNDMNEPSIFYTAESLANLSEMMKGLKNDGGIETDFLFGKVLSLKKYYDHGRDFYQVDDAGVRHLHRDVRNVYGFNMARAVFEGLKRIRPEQRVFSITRSSYAGIQRYAILWTGDNESQWEQLLSEIKMVQSISLAGVSFTGCDVGGFGGNCHGELLARWTQFGAFLPFFRNHSAMGTRPQEPWAFDDEIERIVKKTVELRYSLLPYIYSVLRDSSEGNSLMIRPLVMIWPEDRDTYQADDQYMFGPSLMVAPVYTLNARGRHVYLPGCDWLDLNSGEIVRKGHHWAEAPLDTVPLYLKEDSLLVSTEPSQYLESAVWSLIEVKGFVRNRTVFDLYEDDGTSEAYTRGKYSLKRITVEKLDDGILVDISPQEGELKLPARKVSIEITDGDKNYRTTLIDSSGGVRISIK